MRLARVAIILLKNLPQKIFEKEWLNLIKKIIRKFWNIKKK